MGLSAAAPPRPSGEGSRLVSAELLSLPGVHAPRRFWLSLVTSLGRSVMFLQEVGGLARAFLLEPLHVEVLLLFQSPTMKAGPTWMPPKCGGMTGNSFTRSPSRSCRSRWGSEPCPHVCTAVCPRVRAGTPPSSFWSFSSKTLSDSDTVLVPKKASLQNHSIYFFSTFPTPNSLLFCSDGFCRTMTAGCS